MLIACLPSLLGPYSYSSNTCIQNEIQVLNNDLKYLFSETLFNGVPLLRYIPEIFGCLVVICESVSISLEISNENRTIKEKVGW